MIWYEHEEVIWQTQIDIPQQPLKMTPNLHSDQLQ